MNKWLLMLLATASFHLVSCNSDGIRKHRIKKFTERDITITPQNAYTDLFLDTGTVSRFIAEYQMDDSAAEYLRSFYNSRNYQYAWFVKDGISEHGVSFWNLLNSYVSVSGDSSLIDSRLKKRMTEFTSGDTTFTPNRDSLAVTELELTRHFFEYARVAYAGRIEPSDLQWFIPRRKIDAKALLDSLVKTKGENLDNWEPVTPEYKAMKKELVRYSDIQKKGGWPIIPLLDKKKKYKPGDSSETIAALKQHLLIDGDLTEADSSGKYTPELAETVKKVQKRFGYKEDGIIDSALVNDLNVPVEKRVEQMLVNMERMKWMPDKLADNRIVANIPEFKLYVFENGQPAFDMNIVVGKEGNSTVIFNDELKFIVFSPYWNVPRSIVKKEIMPAMAKNSNYLASHGMEIISKGGGVPEIRQKPGGKNSLGRVKFLFPNNYNIYFHDTPSKSLFDREKRAFSHGCIRLQDPVKLANYLLRDQPEWTPEKIDEAMHLDKEKWVTLKDPVPVFISYFTAWVDQDGQLNFREDIYGHDQKMADRLFLK